MRRWPFALVPLLAAAIVMPGCSRKVDVEMGTLTTCAYGHTISDDVKTVEVPVEDVAAYKVRTVRTVCERHAKLEALYEQAQAELAKGDYRAAEATLRKITADDATFRLAQSQLDAIEGDQKPKPDTDSAPSTSTATPKPANPGDGDTSGPVGALLKYAPDSIPGYKTRKPLTDALSITREYVPTGDSDVVLFVIVVEQYRSSAAAKEALTAQVRKGYPKSASEQRVGSHATYFGTDGRRFAALGFTDGAVLVAMEMAAEPGVAPSKLKDVLLEAAGSLP